MLLLLLLLLLSLLLLLLLLSLLLLLLLLLLSLLLLLRLLLLLLPLPPAVAHGRKRDNHEIYELRGACAEKFEAHFYHVQRVCWFSHLKPTVKSLRRLLGIISFMCVPCRHAHSLPWRLRT